MCKSPVREHRHSPGLHGPEDGRSTRRKQLRDREVPWEGAVNPVSRRTEMPFQADGARKLAQHSNARCSAPGVNGAVAQAEFTSLLRKICPPGSAATPGAASSNGRREGAEVSRGHSSGEASPRRPELVKSSSTPQPEALASRPNGRADESREAVGKHGGTPEGLLKPPNPTGTCAPWAFRR